MIVVTAFVVKTNHDPSWWQSPQAFHNVPPSDPLDNQSVLFYQVGCLRGGG
jgi:hypothetical protein